MLEDDKEDPEHTLATGHASGAPARELKVGDIVGGTYKLKSVVGRGGMGVVYRAEHLSIHCDRALKALAHDRIDPVNWQRFQTEGKAIARLDHINIVKVYDMGTDGPDCLYYVMDLLQGVPLSEVIQRKGSINVEETLQIFSQICAGLGYAHKRGLVHRDVKPSNIFLLDAGPGQVPLVKVIDYGLVKLTDDSSLMQQSQTATGLVCGSPLYMSPEQCVGGKIDTRSDIYSLGCALFECLTGEPPFCGDNGLATAFMHENDAPPRLADGRPDKEYPESLEEVVGRMLKKIPAQRYQTMEQVAQDLERVGAGRSINREAVHQGGAQFELDRPDDSKMAATTMFFLFGAVMFIVLIGGVVLYFFAQPKKPVMPPVAATSLSPQQIDVRDLYAKWPQISNGVVSKNGVQVRVFNFPDEPVGFVCWGQWPTITERLAKGEVQVPGDQPVKLKLSRPEGAYARQFPIILTKIGASDISALAVPEPQHQLDDTLLLSDISPQLIHAVSGWTALNELDFYHSTLKRQTVLTLNELPSVSVLLLRDASVEGVDLAQVKWLDRLTYLDVKGMTNVDPVLCRLAGAPNLFRLSLDVTSPSLSALRGLTRCPRLQILSLSQDEINDQSLAVICDIPNLTQLWLSHTGIKASSFGCLKKLKRLTILHVTDMTAAEIAALHTMLPHCSIEKGKDTPFVH